MDFVGFLLVINNEGRGLIRQEGTQSWTVFAFQILHRYLLQGRTAPTMFSLLLEGCHLPNESEITLGHGLGDGQSPL